MTLPGRLDDDRELSARVRAYAADVVNGAEWPLGPAAVDLDRVTWGTSTRAERRHATTYHEGGGRCRVLVAAKTARLAGFAAVRTTVRHELVHVHQLQTDGVEAGHGESFRRWIDPLDLPGVRSDHYDVHPAEYRYRAWCDDCDAFALGRYRLCDAVRDADRGRRRCGECGGRLTVRSDAPGDEDGFAPPRTRDGGGPGSDATEGKGSRRRGE
jgi:predicted SprT family Zn-dependent metalloprotease